MTSSRSRSKFIEPAIAAYALEHSSGPDGVQLELQHVTAERTGTAAGMQIGDDQAVLLEILARATGARRAVEIGTFTGYSALALARGLGPEGHLLCCDVSREWTAIAREHWEKAGVADRIELRIGPALDTLAALPADETFDLAFVDADKTNYRPYYEALLPRLRPGGLLLVDNTLWSGAVLDDGDTTDDTVAIRALNDHIAADPRVRVVLLPIGDGLTIAQRLAAEI
ncbi:MAG TPA: class I SAM-dependent methyltransferase [Acidimicrobiia bacterium]|nr:class I SAM-dependent methyltransferase [Acidimicrobiia bacterium]